MNLLLDTQVFLWTVDDSPNQSTAVREAMLFHKDPIDRMLIAQAQMEKLTNLIHKS